MGKGVELIAEERQRQIEGEGYSVEYDQIENAGGELAMAAMCYAMLPMYRPEHNAPLGWPWCNALPLDGFKPTPKDRVRELQKAGAFIAAEIDRLIAD